MSSTLIHNVRIFDGESVITENGCILFSNGLVQHVSLATPSPPLSADHIIDGTGHTILPGLIDAHVHIGDDEQHLAQCLAFGVTTVLEMFGEPENVSKVKKICGQRMDVADLKSACHGATIKGGWPGAPLLAFAEDKEAVSSDFWSKLKHFY
jgi:adenine deaminase